MKKNVSACIVTHNNMSCIQRTIDSLLKNTSGVNFRLFVVDNLSTDGTPEFLRKKYPNLDIIEPKTNKGFGSGHNVVLPLIESDYHCIINPDIYIKEDVISPMAKYMDAHPDIGLLTPQICFPDGRYQILGKRDPSLKYLIASKFRSEKPGKALREYAMLDRDLTIPQDIENATGCFIMLKTQVFKDIGGFDERYFMYFEDCDLSRTVRQHRRVVYFPNVTVFHVWGRESKKNFRLMLVQIKSMFKYFMKWRKGT